MKKRDIIEWQDLAHSDNHLFGPMIEGLRGKYHDNVDEVKTTEMKWIKEHSTEFYEGGALLLRETMTMLSRKDGIHRRPASF